MQKGKRSGEGDKMIDLKTARGEIDRIDEELVRLFLKRLKVSRDVALAKRESMAVRMG